LTPTQRLANAVGGMLLIQVVLGGAATLVGFPIVYHIVWGVLTFAVLLALTAMSARSLGTNSIIFKLSIAVVIDFIVQGILGFIALPTTSYMNDVVLIHLTNAFILAVLATTLISFNRSLAPIEASAHAASTAASPPK
jgi:heme A synthase